MTIALDGMVVDSFAGGGGAGIGIAWALGRSADLAINHDEAAIAMYQANHPDTRAMTEDVWKVDPRKAIGRKKVGLLWASPDCKHFSRAKGDKPVEKSIRSLAWVVIKWADQVKPRVIMLENVREFEGWGPIVPAWRCAACGWSGTEGQAILKRQRRRCPRCDSLRLKMSDKFMPDPKREGLTFKRWVGRLRGLGYRVEWKTLNAADYGAPTHRRRLFLIARRDGLPIVWPEPTHGNPKKLDEAPLFGRLKPWRTAAECIDWSIPCPSIFDRKKPLADATMRRIAMGIKRYVLENANPFIVRFRGSPDSGAVDIEAPMPTVTAGSFIKRPAGAGHALGVCTPYLVPLTHHGDNRTCPPDAPMPTITTAHRGEMAVVAPVLSKYHGQKSDESRCNSTGEPFNTLDTQNRFAVIAPTLIQTGYGERDGQQPRAPGLDKPLGTTVAGGCKHALVAAFLAKHFGGVVGHDLERPLGTATTKDHHSLVAANLVRFNHDDAGVAVDGPLPTVTVTNHAALVYSFLQQYAPGSLNGRDAIGIVIDREESSGGPRGRNDLEAGRSDQQPAPATDNASESGIQGEERLSAGERESGRQGDAGLCPPAGLDRATRTDTGGHGPKPRRRKKEQQCPDESGAGVQIGKSQARLQDGTAPADACAQPGNAAAHQGPSQTRKDVSADSGRVEDRPNDRVPPFQVALLTKYFGTAIGVNLLEPMPTATTNDRFGLVTVTIDGELYVIVDIGMRMLSPRELARAQGFPDTYILTGTKTSQVARIGNSVPPVMSKALVETNLVCQTAETVA